MTGTPILDGHTDVLLDVHGSRSGDRSFSERSAEGHVDLARLREGNVAAAFFASFVPTPDGGAGGGSGDTGNGDVSEGGAVGRADETDDREPTKLPKRVDHDVARRETGRMLDLLDRWADGIDGFRLVGDAADLDACLAGDVVGAVPHLEGAEAIAPDLSNLDALYERGVRSVGLCWSRPNAFGHGVPLVHDASPDMGPGLTDAGERLVRACGERGVVVDCAHLNAAGFGDVARVSDAPLVVSHGAAHAVSPAARNLTDDQLRAVADSGGVVGLTFAVSQLRPDGENDPGTPLSVLVDHLDHVVDVMGPEHVALGSDLDGTTVPDTVGDASGLPRVLDALRDRGWSERTVERVAHGNWARILRETL
ncbi:dipeptidase [Halorarum salinum]|uniref:Membrane dipeptidase n=1 Tax=Halorarum salinum TaxID=2743089 RepID=A0A7D5LDK5_9EURY|nr:dipeptidase [Halobaculum salinum]QLG63827.1 membrane dipeptidase [Halobaculum salinum]